MNFTTPNIPEGGLLQGYGGAGVPSTYSEQLSATFQESYIRAPWMSVLRMGEILHAAVGDYKQYTEAEWKDSQYYREGLDFQFGVNEEVARITAFRKDEEHRRAEIMDKTPEGFGRASSLLAVDFVAQMLDPINVAASFIPITKGTQWASTAATAKTAGARLGARVKTGAIEGLVGNALVEPLVFLSADLEQSNYSIENSVLNVAMGIPMGVGFHTGLGAIGDVGPKAKVKRALGRMELRAKEARAKAQAEWTAQIKTATSLDNVVLSDGNGISLATMTNMSAWAKKASYETAGAHLAEGRVPDVEPIINVDKTMNEKKPIDGGFYTASRKAVIDSGKHDTTTINNTYTILEDIAGNGMDRRLIDSPEEFFRFIDEAAFEKVDGIIKAFEYEDTTQFVDEVGGALFDIFKETGNKKAFVKGLTEYLTTGKVTNPKLQARYDAYRAWMSSIYESVAKVDVAKTVVDSEWAPDLSVAPAPRIHQNIKKVFDGWLSQEPPKVEPAADRARKIMEDTEEPPYMNMEREASAEIDATNEAASTADKQYDAFDYVEISNKVIDLDNEVRLADADLDNMVTEGLMTPEERAAVRERTADEDLKLETVNVTNDLDGENVLSAIVKCATEN